jgi:seryl-tRNA synthetase
MSGAGNYDYEAVLPYNGNWIEFQNLSVNGEMCIPRTLL